MRKYNFEDYERLRLKIKVVKFLKSKSKFGKNVRRVVGTPKMRDFLLMENENRVDIDIRKYRPLQYRNDKVILETGQKKA